ncbi:MAG: autotransporter domain-containing protein [Opitutae bacterium]|nr:autotransporter domain-containing protein [Opitutae bacterium]
MTNLRNRLLGALLVAGFIAATAAAQQPAPRSYSSYFFFGDSLTDNGNLFAATGSPPPPYFQGRVSNGPTYAEYLRPGLAPALTAAATVKTNLNFAFAGATATPGVTSPPNIGLQIGLYQARAITAGANDMFVVLAGANDLLNATANPATQNGPALTVTGQTAAQAVGGHVQTLLGLGAKNLFVLNVPNIANTPRFITGSGAPARSIIEVGALAFNTELRSRLGGLNIGSGVNVTLFDLASVFDLIRRNAATFGFTVTTQEYLGVLQSGANPGDINGYMFFDGIHPTTKTHQLLSLALTEAMNPEFALGHAAVQGSAVLVAAGMNADSIDTRLAQLRGLATRHRAEGFASFDYQDGSRDVSGYRNGFGFSSSRATAGVDWSAGDHLTVGLALSQGRTKATHRAAAGGFKLQGETGTVFAALNGMGVFSFEGMAFYGTYNVRDIRRTTSLGFQATGQNDSGVWGGSLRMLGNMKWPGFRLQPFLGLRYLDARVGSYNETGVAGLNMLYREQDAKSSAWQAGAFADWEFRLAERPLRLSLSGLFQGELHGGDRQLAGRLYDTFVSNDATATVADGDGDSFKLGARLGGALGRHWGWSLAYSAEFRDDGDTGSRFGFSIHSGF